MLRFKIIQHIRAFYEYLWNDRKILNSSHTLEQIKKQDHRNRLIAIFIIYHCLFNSTAKRLYSFYICFFFPKTLINCCAKM